MALTMAQLKGLVDAEGLKYYVDPNRDALMMRVKGANGEYELLVLLEVGGEFLQLRSLGYHTCPPDNPHTDELLKLLGTLNYRLRFVKFGWDPEDGEITVYGDTWIKDGGVTEKQFGHMARAYFSVMDLNFPRIDQTIRTGKDPGEATPGGAKGGAAGLPPEMQELLDKLLKGTGGGGGGKDDDEGGIDSI